MKLRGWIIYLIYSVLILLIILLEGYVGNFLSANIKQGIHVNYFYLILSIIIGISVGLVLGLEHFIRETKKEGTWRINLPKLILVGLPSLYASLTMVFFYSGSHFLQNIIAYPLFYFFRYIYNYLPLFELTLGYVVITSFYKYNENR